MKFEVHARGSKGTSTLWNAHVDGLPPIDCAIPAEFAGPGGGYSPEDLFSLSLISCLIATFKVYCEKSNVTFEQVQSRAILIIDRHPGENFIGITQIEVFIDVTGASDAEKVKGLLEKSIKDCMISNAIKSGKTFHLNVS